MSFATERKIDLLLQEADRTYPSPDLSVYVYYWKPSFSGSILFKNCETFSSAAVRICIEEMMGTFQDVQTCLIYVYSTPGDFFASNHAVLAASSFIMDVFLEMVEHLLSERTKRKNVTEENWEKFQKEWVQGRMAEEVPASETNLNPTQTMTGVAESASAPDPRPEVVGA